MTRRTLPNIGLCAGTCNKLLLTIPNTSHSAAYRRLFRDRKCAQCWHAAKKAAEGPVTPFYVDVVAQVDMRRCAGCNCRLRAPGKSTGGGKGRTRVVYRDSMCRACWEQTHQWRITPSIRMLTDEQERVRALVLRRVGEDQELLEMLGVAA